MTPPISHDDAMRTCSRILSDYEAMQEERETALRFVDESSVLTAETWNLITGSTLTHRPPTYFKMIDRLIMNALGKEPAK